MSMKRENRGRKRKFSQSIPAHINQAKLPDKCYWDKKGKYWFTSYKDNTGAQRRKKIAGPEALMSELHKLIEEFNGIERNTFAYIVEKYMESSQYQILAPKSKQNHENSYRSIKSFITKLKKPMTEIPLSLWNDALVQKFIDKMTTNRGPTAARFINQFIRRVFSWSLKRGYVKYNPARRTELSKERQKQIYPTHKAYNALLTHAKKNGTFKQKFKGSCAHYIWIVMETEYLLRLRGIECRTLTDADITKHGMLVNRTKGSRGNLTTWNERLKQVITEAQKTRDEIFKLRNKAIPLKPSDRFLVVNTLGEEVKAQAYQSAWGRFIRNAIDTGVIDESERFSLHDLKRKGITDTEGTRADKKEASGHVSDKMLDIYDKSMPIVNPSAE